MLHLRSVARTGDQPALGNSRFPFSVPAVGALSRIDFTAAVTFFVGENGTGKSTLLAGIACAAGSVSAGAEGVKTDPTLAHARLLADGLRLAWSKRTRRGLFLRAEDFFGYVKRLAQTQAELERDLAGADEASRGRSAFARGQARMAYAGQLHAMRARYPREPGAASHGEAFFDFFEARFVPDGLYLLDEPEAPLSPLRQLAFVKLLMDKVEQGAQFVIATHSPIILACPGAAIHSFDGGEIHPVEYADLEHVRLTRDFLNNPGVFLSRL